MQAANLHAMLDESLSKADAMAVKMALGEQTWDDEEGVCVSLWKLTNSVSMSQFVNVSSSIYGIYI